MSWDELKHNAAPPQPDAHPDAPSAEDPSERSGQDPVFGYYCTGTVKPAAHQRQGLFVLLALLMILLCAVLSLLMNLRVQIKRDDGQIVLQIGNGEKKATSSAADDSSDETQSALAVPAPAATGADSGVSLQISGADDTQALTLQQIYAKVIPSVVSITSQTSSGEVTGTGIIMTADGYIITNCHVIEGGDTPQVLLQDDDSYQAAVIGSDETSDLAVLKVEADGLQAAEFGDSTTLKKGQTVYAIGNPGGSEFFGSFTKGMVSAIDRPISSESGYEMKCIQHTTPINSGNSGGALMNEYGQVIGINSSKIVSTGYEGMAFAIPISDAKQIIDDIIANGYVTDRPKLGISYAAAEKYQQYAMVVKLKNLPSGSLVIASINSDSSLANSKAKVGDLITAVDGEKLDTADVLLDKIENGKVGDKLKLELCRINSDYSVDTFTVEATLVEDKGNSSETETTTESQAQGGYDWGQFFGSGY